MAVSSPPSGGIFNLYKPVGITSHDLVETVRRILPGKCGHAGTLDPFARGVMLVCWGRATRLTRLFQDLPKVYRAWVRFGIATDTYDVTGTITGYSDAPVGEETLRGLLCRFQGEISQQVPPYSARKFQGKPMYCYARSGVHIPVSEKTIRIHRLELRAFREGRFAWAELMVECSSGTYIRSLAEELGRLTGTGAYLSSLRREGVGQFTIDGSVSVSGRSRSLSRERIMASLVTPSEALYWLDECKIAGDEATRFTRGNPVRCRGREDAGSTVVKVLRDREFLGIGRIDPTGGMLKPDIVMG